MPMDTDSEDDSDYVPPKDTGPDADEPARKRARTNPQSELATSEDTTHKKTSDEIYAAFKASLTAPSAQPAQDVPPVAELVKIVKRYRYAGEETIEVKEVPADSAEAKKWPRWQPSDDAEASTVTNNASTSDAGPSAAGGVASPSSATASTSTSTASTPAKPPGKRPGPRKAKSKLADIPAKKEPVKRLTTLDKSAMDWRAHVESGTAAEMKDELEANKRGGGYLDKVEFLQRVEARKEDVLDASKSKRRR